MYCCIQVINECSEAENWLLEKKHQQDALPKHANPVLLVSEIKKKAEALDRLVGIQLFR
jgi:heat shock protein 4